MASSRYIKFSFPISTYFPDALKAIAADKNKGGERALRKEYSRLRDVARKRIIRMGKSEFKRTQYYKKWKDEFPKLSEIQNASDLAHELSNIARFLTSTTSTVSGLKEYQRKQAETLQASGFTFITEKNVFRFMEFMDWLEEVGGKNFYPSGVMEALETGLKEKKLSWTKIKKHFREHIEEMKSGNPVPPYDE